MLRHVNRYASKHNGQELHSPDHPQVASMVGKQLLYMYLAAQIVATLHKKKRDHRMRQRQEQLGAEFDRNNRTPNLKRAWRANGIEGGPGDFVCRKRAERKAPAHKLGMASFS